MLSADCSLNTRPKVVTTSISQTHLLSEFCLWVPPESPHPSPDRREKEAGLALSCFVGEKKNPPIVFTAWEVMI